MMATQQVEAPVFRARLESAGADAGTVFVAGDFDSYGIDILCERARYGFHAVSIRVDGVGHHEAEQALARGLAEAVRRGVRVHISTSC